MRPVSLVRGIIGKHLEIKFKGKNISDALEMTVDEAEDFFKAVPSIREKMSTLKRSGSEVTRKLANRRQRCPEEKPRGSKTCQRELSRRSSGANPIHLRMSRQLGYTFEGYKKASWEILHELVDKGNTVIVIEHNLDVIKTAD